MGIVKKAQRRGMRRPLGTVRRLDRARREMRRVTPDWVKKHGGKPATIYAEGGKLYIEPLTQERFNELKAEM